MQSNIDVNVERVYPQYVSEIDKDATERVRLFRVENEAVLEGPRDDVRSRGWTTLSKQNAWKFSAVGNFLGKRMEQTQGVVQGIVQCSWGGTPIESWLSCDAVSQFDKRMASEADYYADSDLRRVSVEDNRKASQRWDKVLEENDPGISGQWTKADLDDSGWTKANQYELPVQSAYGFCGTYWMRQQFKSKKPLSPLPVAVKNLEDGTVQVTFDQPLTEDALRGFELAGNDGKFHNVEAKAQGANVIIKGTGTRVRYAWKNNPVEANCCGVNDKLPATPFEMDVPQSR